jgi:hypothetical protein
MDRWTYRYYVTQDLMLFGVALEALTLYPTSAVIFIAAVPIAMGSMLHLFTLLTSE